MNYFCDSKDFGKTIDSCVKDTQKKIRNAAYKTLESVAERSRRAVIANYFKKFPDENGIKMNSYFVKNPDMILGEMQMVSSRFGMESTCKPYENAELSELLQIIKRKKQ